MGNLLFVIDNEVGKLAKGGEVGDRVHARLVHEAALGKRRTRVIPQRHLLDFLCFTTSQSFKSSNDES